MFLKCTPILEAKWSQSLNFVSALLDTSKDIIHILPSGHKDHFWAYPGANRHGNLLEQLCNNRLNAVINSLQVQMMGGSGQEAQVYMVKDQKHL